VKFLVTGATGFVGRRLVKRLVDDGNSVTVLVRNRLRLGELRELVDRVIDGDLTADIDLSEAMSDVDCVLHLAAVVASHGPEGYYSANVEGTRRLAKAAAAAANPPLMIYCSSLSAGGPSTADRPRREEDPERPVSHYGRSKLAAEKVLGDFSSQLRLVIVRPPIVYGPGDMEFFPRYSKMIRRGILLTAADQPRYSLVHVDDLCEALILAARRGLSPEHVNGRIYYVCDGVEHTLDSMGGILAEKIGARLPRIIRIPLPLIWMAAWCGMKIAHLYGRSTLLNVDKVHEMKCQAWTCSSERAATELGFRHSMEFSDGMATAVAGEVA
jgi:nucleoside-diphosphate-sugar epimerase